MPINKNALLRYRVIDKCLTNPLRRYPNIRQIMEAIEKSLGTSISESMFNKDIQQMKSIYDAPIVYNREHKGYAYSQEGFSIMSFPLTHEEIEALDFSTALLQQLKNTRIFQHFENAINKVIEGYRISVILGKSEKQLIQVEEPVRSDSSRWLEPILHAIVQKQVIKLVYRGFGRDEKLHKISPYLLKEYRNRWYMIGYSNDREAVLIFALDRMKSITTASRKYKSPDNFDPDDFFRYSFGITRFDGEHPEQVVLSFTPAQANYVMSQPLHHSQEVIVQNEKEVQVKLHVYITAELRMMILSYGAQVKVLQPRSLQKEISAEIARMGKVYEKW